MNTDTMAAQKDEERAQAAAIVKRFVEVGVTVLLIAASLFISAGRLDWVMAWVYVGLYLAGIAINATLMLRRCPDLIAERAEVREGTKGWDVALGTTAMLLSLPITLVVAGLDFRFGWSPGVALVIRLAALALWASGHGLLFWAMQSNRFFSGTVRIQEERGHTVAMGGPYRLVRHPGYAGLIVSSLAASVMLGSLWGLVPAALGSIGFAVRTALEDRTLHEELDGYRGYAAQVKYRLLPGVW